MNTRHIDSASGYAVSESEEPALCEERTVEARDTA